MQNTLYISIHGCWSLLIAAEQAITDDMHLFGGIKVASGMKNVSNTTKSLLTWSAKSPSTTTSSSPHVHKAPTPAEATNSLAYQSDYAMAGGRSRTNEVEAGERKYSWSETKRAQMIRPSPFGVDEAQSSQASAGGAPMKTGNPKSLADVMKSKSSEPKSLASVMGNRMQR
jgi:hypothetical protein